MTYYRKFTNKNDLKKWEFLVDLSSCLQWLGNGTEDIESRSDLFPKILRDEAVGRLYELGKVTKLVSTLILLDDISI